MHAMNTRSAVTAACAASRCLNAGGLLVLTGAQAALGFGGKPLSFALGYGMSKAATHQLALSMADEGQLAGGATVATVLPATIDTPQNRGDMPDADFEAWTPPDDIAHRLVEWAGGRVPGVDRALIQARPANGAFVSVETASGVTRWNVWEEVPADDIGRLQPDGSGGAFIGTPKNIA